MYRDTAGSASKEIQYEKYQKHVMKAMKATYERLSGLPYYDGIRDAVEYSIIQLYSYALTNCLMQKGQVPVGQIVQRMQELYERKQMYIQGGYDNPYVKNKISEPDIQIMRLNDKSPQQLLQLIDI